MRTTFFRTRVDRWLWLSILLAAVAALAIAILPWETFGAPILMVLLLGGAAVGWLLWDSPEEERSFVLRLILAALGVRVLAVLVFYGLTGGNPIYLYKDANGYDRLAWILAQAWHHQGIIPESLGRLSWMLDDAYPRVLAGLYFIIGRSPAAAVAINAVLGAVTVYLGYRISAILFGVTPARWAGWLMAFYTGFWLWGLMTLKDTVFLFLILLFFLALYRLGYLLASGDFSRRRILRASGWAAVMILAWLGARAVRDTADYAGKALAVAAAVLPVVWFLRSGKIGRWLVLIAVGAIGLALFWSKVILYPLPTIPVSGQAQLFQFTEVPRTVNISVFAQWIFDHPLGFVSYLILSVVSTALAPYAWILPGTVPGVNGFDPSMVAFPGMWLWYAVLPFAALGLIPAVRRTRGDAWPLVVFGAGLFLVFSLFIPREFRHRDIIMPFGLMLAAVGLVYARKWWYLGLLFWIPLTGLIAWKVQSPIPFVLAGILAALGGTVWWLRRNRKLPAPLSGKDT
jgi:hypothetical protein